MATPMFEQGLTLEDVLELSADELRDELAGRDIDTKGMGKVEMQKAFIKILFPVVSVTCTAFPYVTLHSQPFPITRLVAVLWYTCYFLPLKGLRALSFVCTAVTLLRIKLA